MEKRSPPVANSVKVYKVLDDRNAATNLRRLGLHRLISIPKRGRGLHVSCNLHESADLGYLFHLECAELCSGNSGTAETDQVDESYRQLAL